MVLFYAHFAGQYSLSMNHRSEFGAPAAGAAAWKRKVDAIGRLRPYPPWGLGGNQRKAKPLTGVKVRGFFVPGKGDHGSRVRSRLHLVTLR